MEKVIRLKYVTLHLDTEAPKEKRIRNVFPDGREWNAYPHPEQPHYYVIAHRCGYGDDLWAYAWEHEFAHSFVCERLGDEPSYVLSCMVDGIEPDRYKVLQEEALVQTFQRWIRASERPIIEGASWSHLKDDAIRLLANGH
jgi:hypothetical protein